MLPLNPGNSKGFIRLAYGAFNMLNLITLIFSLFCNVAINFDKGFGYIFSASVMTVVLWSFMGIVQLGLYPESMSRKRGRPTSAKFDNLKEAFRDEKRFSEFDSVMQTVSDSSLNTNDIRYILDIIIQKKLIKDEVSLEHLYELFSDCYQSKQKQNYSHRSIQNLSNPKEPKNTDFMNALIGIK